MSQSPLEAQMQTLRDMLNSMITRANKLLANYHEAVRLKLIQPDKGFTEEDITVLKSMLTKDSNGTKKWLKHLERINTLPLEDQPGALRNTKSGVTNLNDLLKKLETKYPQLNKLTPDEMNFRSIQKEYADLLDSLLAKAKSKSVPLTKDGVIEAFEKLLKEAHDNFLMEFSKGTFVIDIGNDKIKAFKQGVEKLGRYNGEFNKLQSAIDVRVTVLHAYNQAIERRDNLVTQGQGSAEDALAFVSSKEINQAKYYLTPDELKILDGIKTKANAVFNKMGTGKKDYLDEAAKLLKKSPDDIEVARLATKTCNDAVAKFVPLLNDLDGAVFLFKRLVRKRANEKVVPIQKDIDAQYKGFGADYNTHFARLEKFGELFKTSIKELRDLNSKLDIIYLSKVDQQDLVAFATQKLALVKEVVDDFKKLQAKHELLINKEIANEQQRRKDEINKKIKAVEKDINDIMQANKGVLAEKFQGYQFDELEKAQLSEVQSYLVQPPSSSIKSNAVENVESFTRKLNELISKKQRLVELLSSLKETRELHNIARNSYEQHGIKGLIGQINGNNGVVILSVMSKYLDKNKYDTFIKELSQNFGELSVYGLNAVRYFNKTLRSSLIKRKCDFIDKLTHKGIDYKDFVNKDNVIEVVSELSKPKLEEFITLKNLHNEPFCNALLKLKDLVGLTPENVKKLLDNENACAFINQFNTLKLLYKNQSLIIEYITADLETLAAFNNFKGHIPEDCQLSFFQLMKKNPDIKEILSNKDSLKDNIAFLSPLFKDATPDADIFNPDKLPHIFYAISNLKNKNEKQMDKENPDNDLKKIGAFMEGINKIIDTAKDAVTKNDDKSKFPELQETLNGLLEFRRKAMFVLVNERPIVEKKANLVKLADQHLKQTNWFDRIIELIGKAFGSTSERFFSKANVGVKNVIDATQFKGGSAPVTPPDSQGTGDITNQFKGKLLSGKKDDAAQTPAPGSTPPIGTKG